MLRVTGGAGFNGSNMAADRNGAGRSDVAARDTLRCAGAWRNPRRRRIAAASPAPIGDGNA